MRKEDIQQDLELFDRTLYVIHSPSEGKTLDYTFSDRLAKQFLEKWGEDYEDVEILKRPLGDELFEWLNKSWSPGIKEWYEKELAKLNSIERTLNQFI